METKTENKVAEKETKVEKKIVKKEEAIARGMNVPISLKHSMYICNFIKGKSIDWSIAELQKVLKMQRPIPYKGEVPHRSFPGMMSGRYPINASTEFIYLLKALKGNAIASGLDIDKTRIYFGSASWASRPQRKSGGNFKRINITLKAKEFTGGKK